MELLLKSIQMDWAVLLPIFICSILTVGVALNRWAFYNDNKRDIFAFLRNLQGELAKNNLSGAQLLSKQLGGVTGELAEEGVRILEEQNDANAVGDFAASFDISMSLALRKLEQYLSVLGTIGGVAPFLGLFGTVVRILFTFQDLAMQGNQSASVATGIASALIATAFGLGVAIVAVVLFNSFQSIVARYESDFQMMKLLFLTYSDKKETTGIVKNQPTFNPQI
ncbi:MAG: MotA/TolQ/ExbB proton channel family protein [bacterium]|nr:MotA/TolQ/ExbB proton channel family protein [bacterium]